MAPGDGAPGRPDGAVVGDAGAFGRAEPDSGVAQFPQNFAAGGLTVPQFGQATANGVAHSTQNFAPTRFSVPQFEQINRLRLHPGAASKNRV